MNLRANYFKKIFLKLGTKKVNRGASLFTKATATTTTASK